MVVTENVKVLIDCTAVTEVVVPWCDRTASMALFTTTARVLAHFGQMEHLKCSLGIFNICFFILLVHKPFRLINPENC